MSRAVLGMLCAMAALGLACSAGDPSDAGGTGTQGGGQAVGSAPQAAPTAPWTSFRDGQYEVGTAAGMVTPGKYRTTVPADSLGCYWERQKDLSGSFEAVITNGSHKAGEPVVVTIAASDKGFKTQRCGEWRLSP
jgi:hypothetical protein